MTAGLAASRLDAKEMIYEIGSSRDEGECNYLSANARHVEFSKLDAHQDPRGDRGANSEPIFLSSIYGCR